MYFCLSLLVIGLLGFVTNRKNVIMMFICIEIILLSLTLLIVIKSMGIDDMIGQAYAIFIITMAGVESALGLAILVSYYRLRGNISIEKL